MTILDVKTLIIKYLILSNSLIMNEKNQTKRPYSKLMYLNKEIIKFYFNVPQVYQTYKIDFL